MGIFFNVDVHFFQRKVCFFNGCKIFVSGLVNVVSI